jgi:hypothetical protein
LHYLNTFIQIHKLIEWGFGVLGSNTPVRELAVHEKRAKDKEKVLNKNSSRENKFSGESTCISAIVDVDVDIDNI